MQFQNFAGNVALMIVAAVLLQIVMRRTGSFRAVHRAVFGLLYGCIGILSMLWPAQIAPGVFFGGRAIVLSVAGFSCGPLTAAIAAAVCAVYRIWQGGPGLPVGLGVIAESAALGSVFFVLRRRSVAYERPAALWGFGMLVSLVMLGLMLLLPGGAGADVLSAITLPVLLLYPAAIMLLCLLCCDFEKNTRDEASLRASEEKFRTVADWTCDWETWTDPDGRFQYSSPSAESITGYGPKEFMSDPNLLFRIVHPHDLPRCREHFAACERVEASELEFRIIDKEGAVRLIEHRCRPVFGHDGRFLGRRASNRDITRYREAENTLLESERKYSDLFENMSQGVFYQHADGTLTDVNPAALGMLGLSREKFLSRTSQNPEWNVILPDGSRLPPQAHPSMVALRTGKPVRDLVLGVFNALTGSFVWMSVNAKPEFREGDSAPFRVFVTLHDLTAYQDAQKNLMERERQVEVLFAESQQARRALLSILEDDREAQRAVRESDELFRAVVGTATDAIITLDGKGKVILWNRAAEQIFGYSEQEILGSHFSILYPQNMREQNLDNLMKAIDSGVLSTPSRFFEFPGVRKNGSEFLGEVAFAFISRQGDVLITQVVRDITERKLIEQEAMRSAQLASIGELAAGVAHEINNPIMGVINYAQILLNRARTAGGETELQDRIIREGNRIAGIVSNLLNFSRPSADTLAPVTVQEIFEPSFQLMWKLFQQSGIHTEVRLPEGLPPALAQSQKIQQVFINILSNALYALNKRFPGDHADKKFDVSALELSDEGGDFVRVVFHDHGCGIEPEYLEKICNPFFTTKPVGKGTGLGLSICHNIVKEHGGRLLFESRLGEFTRVMVDLPVNSAAQPAVPLEVN